MAETKNQENTHDDVLTEMRKQNVLEKITLELARLLEEKEYGKESKN